MIRTTTFLLLFLLGAIPIQAQLQAFAYPLPPGADTSLNSIQLRGDSSTWRKLVRKLDTLVFDGTGRIDVVHMGGSHVQADMWSMQLRHRLQTMVPGVRASRGFIFPYNMAKSNNPYWYEPKYTGEWTAVRNVTRGDSSTLGLAGCAVTTRDTLTTLRITFRGTGYPGYSTDRVRVYHLLDSSYSVQAAPRDTSVRWTSTVVREPGYTEIVFDRPLDTLELVFRRTASDQKRFTLLGLELRNSDPGFTLHAAGINGASTSSWLRCQRMPAELAAVNPDLVILSIGINDAFDSDFSAARFEANYDQLIRRIRAAVPDVAILLTTNNDAYARRRDNNPHAAAVRDAMLRLSTRHGAAVWDLYGVMGGATSMRRWQQAGLAKADRIHFTREGYTLVGDLLFEALMKSYATHLRTAQ